ncbi:cytochrome P450 [Gymnopus androsaceus JB14]|uniref:Cytochrome P450 n=1 Tax=Gymnopus androsaceus JB14 TaxID=1447944 RepID=A0A6A4I2U7_9AGAR|nr:cytochrome P450 [Gymnopus androsaceus JB14]
MSPSSPSSLTEAFVNIKASHLIVASVVFIVYFILHKLYIYPFLLSPLRNVPGPSLGHPLWGQFPKVINSESGLPQREWVKQYGPVVRVIGPVGLDRLMLLKPEALHKMMVADWLDYPRPGFLRKVLGHVTGYGLLTVTGDEHRQMRKAMNPAFSIPNLMAQTDMYYDAIQGLVDIFASQTISKEGKEIQVYDWMSKVTLDIICATSFGYHTDSLHNPHNELAEAYEHLVGLQSGPNIAMLILTMVIPGMPRFLQSELAHQYRSLFTHIRILAPLSTLIASMHSIKRISAQMLKEKMKESIESGMVEGDSELSGKKDIMSILVRARTREVGSGYRMSDEAMMAQVLRFLGAGHETTASGLTWTLWLLVNDISSQERLRAEVGPVYAQNSRPDYKTLRDMKWLDCVVMESLRVMPPVPITLRKAAKSDYIDGLFVPKGTLFWIPIRTINTWTNVWGDDAEEFHPERWLNLPKNYNSTFSTFSFIAGPHMCIGKTMAIIEMKAVLAALIASFTFEPAYEGQTALTAAAITMKPTDGMPLKVKRVQDL